MKVSELKSQIKDIPDDVEVFVRGFMNPCGNIIEAKKAQKSTYGFFGKSIDCIIIEPDIGQEFIQEQFTQRRTECQKNEKT